MRRKLVIGLTGGIGTGKSAALRAFRRLGAGAVGADEIARDLSRRGKPVHRAIVREFGPRYLDKRGELDRSALAAAVFAKPALRRRLERVTHPMVLRRMRELIHRSGRSVVVADVPLLFEAGAQDRFDLTVLVSAPPAEALRRVLRRGDLSRSQVRARMAAQWPIERKAALADVVIDNSGRPARLAAIARKYYRAFELIANHLSRGSGNRC